MTPKFRWLNITKVFFSSCDVSFGVIRQPLLHMDSQGLDWQRLHHDPVLPWSPQQSQGMWQIAHHLRKLLPRSAISMCLPVHQPMQVTWSPLTLNWNGTVLSCAWKESQTYLRVARMIIPGIVLSFCLWCLQPYNIVIEDCVSPTFYSMGSPGHTICKW